MVKQIFFIVNLNVKYLYLAFISCFIITSNTLAVDMIYFKWKVRLFNSFKDFILVLRASVKFIMQEIRQIKWTIIYKIPAIKKISIL